MVKKGSDSDLISTDKPIEVYNAFATDMTLVLGAESYIDRDKPPYTSDPSGKECLKNFVDLFLNSKTSYITLPGSEDEGTPVLITQLRRHLHSLPKAAVNLLPTTEHKVVKGFINLIKSQEKKWLSKWVDFQMLNPIVTSGHKTRVGGMISESGYSIWTQCRKRFMNSTLIKNFPLMPVDQLSKTFTKYYHEKEENRFSSMNEFFVCYAFDVYRRGWQYIEGVRLAGVNAKYFPHKLRNNALENGTDEWESVDKYQDLLWSWGGYMVELVDEPESKYVKSPQQVVEYILAIKEAMSKTGCPKWQFTEIFDENGCLKDEKYLRVLQDWVNATADKARIPLLRMTKKEEPTGVEVAQIIGDGVSWAVSKTVGLPVILIGKLARLGLKCVSRESVLRLDARIENTKRHITNLLYKGTFGYRGLLPRKREHDETSD